jgi:hypothetical protein
LHLANRLGAQPAVENPVDDQGQWNERGSEECRLGNAPNERGAGQSAT